MKRQLLAVVIGSLFALPALANPETTNNEMYAGYQPATSATVKSTDQVRTELLAAKQVNSWYTNGALGTVNRTATAIASTGKSRDEVRAEVAEARRSGDYIVNAELGTTARSL
ncbi:MAG: hypothetical protein ACREVQ_08740 [Burkholderiales bacterium]